jgi:hypothetical protein
MAQARSFEAQDASRTLTEPLEPSHLGLLSEVSALHGGFILGFPKAAELSARADEARFGANVIESIGPSTSIILRTLARQRRFLSERARQLIEALDAVFLTGSWATARIGYTSYATVRNALVVIGRLAIWINEKGATIAGSAVIASALAVTSIPPDVLQSLSAFLYDNASAILSFAAPFPELRNYLGWIIDHFDSVEGGKGNKKVH